MIGLVKTAQPLKIEFIENSAFDYVSAFEQDSTRVIPLHVTSLGALFSADCLEILPHMKDEVVDTAFVDPPFNLGKQYGANTNDFRGEQDYLAWCKRWLNECARILKPGGAIFSYNLPKWNILLGAYLSELGLEFRHWIAIEMSACLPIPGRLHPSRYSLVLHKGQT